ncbi:uncharacterized protein CEXT_244601 [Caerostris extrusa]|uniref:Uncharacterized protein n=1 Tax=Caerostris extrusa TaxID=172846 RepID=A0AAV4VJM1_CAEEX|nr:uncharacterized protein CEXT_244601 [Caerostris extrusa]
MNAEPEEEEKPLALKVSTSPKIEKAPIKILPVDWSLKTKIRFTSPLPFPNKGSFRTFEEVNGTIGFVRCLHSGKADKSDMNSSHGAKVFQHSLVWMFPHLPWLTLFPRYDSCSTSNPYPFITPTMQEACIQNGAKAFVPCISKYECTSVLTSTCVLQNSLSFPLCRSCFYPCVACPHQPYNKRIPTSSTGRRNYIHNASL